MKIGSLFSGIGGLDLGFERAGFEIVWMCEQDPFCRRVLAKHWPGVPCYEDVREIRGATLPPVDGLIGGFPCQDVSTAGHKVGIEGKRSGLWSEYFRLIREIRPRFAVVENVTGLFNNGGLLRVLGDLASIGFDAEWEVISACAFGAPHTRERVFVLAHTECGGLEAEHELEAGPKLQQWPKESGEWLSHPGRASELVCSSAWETPEPTISGVAYGLSNRVGFSMLGNAVSPVVAEYVAWRVRSLAEQQGAWRAAA